MRVLTGLPKLVISAIQQPLLRSYPTDYSDFTSEPDRSEPRLQGEVRIGCRNIGSRVGTTQASGSTLAVRSLLFFNEEALSGHWAREQRNRIRL
jgi:hypothetical protein